MATIKEDYVSFETAKLLKEKGFNGECVAYYSIYKDNNASLHRWRNRQNYVNVKNDGYTIVPTLQMAMKWLREVHHWHIFVVPRWEDIEYMPGEWEEKMVGYQYVIINVGEVARKNEQPTTTALSPESACEKGIKYCLEHLI